MKRKEIIRKQIKDVMIGHAIGDALGIPVEFCDRSELDDKPVIDMTGFGTYPVPAGAWSDDTSMSLAALDSLANGTVDFDDIMGNFVEWLEHDAYTSTGETFDAGRTCVHAIVNYFARNMSAEECGLNDERSNGNGSLMRIHPFALYAYAKEFPRFEWGKLIARASALTHAHERSVIGCFIYTFVLFQILKNPKKDSIRLGLRYAERDLRDFKEITHYRRLFEGTFPSLPRDAIKSTGYVVDTLEAALWCLLTTDNYCDCVLKAVNLGDDTDTVAAVAGGLAGALYGLESIPIEWLAVLKRRDYIESICEKAAESWLTHAET